MNSSSIVELRAGVVGRKNNLKVVVLPITIIFYLFFSSYTAGPERDWLMWPSSSTVSYCPKELFFTTTSCHISKSK
jgi:hypothetical protein